MIGPYYVLNQSRRFAAWGKPGTASRGGDVVLVKIDFALKQHSVNSLAAPAFQVYEEIRSAHNYIPTGTDTGFYSYRHMRHDPNAPWSTHAWAMTVDINWLQNPAGSKLKTDIPRAMRDDILAVRTNSGARVFRWGADWDWDGQTTDHTYVDAMHWECVAHPYDLNTGFKDFDITPTPPPSQDWTKELIMALPTLRKGDGYNSPNPHLRDDVRRMQSCVAIGGVKADNTFNPVTGYPDGLFGPGTEDALKAYQTRNGLSSDGVCGQKSWRSLLGE